MNGSPRTWAGADGADRVVSLVGLVMMTVLPVWMSWLVRQSGASAVGWVALDALEWGGTATLVVLLERGDLAGAGRAAQLLAALLGCDALVDVATAIGTDLVQAVTLASLIELPLAAGLLVWERRSRRTLVGATAVVENATAQVSRRA